VKDAIMERDRIYIRDMRTGNLNAVRASTHIYNMPEEVDRLVESVRHVASHWSDYMTTPTA
jgi:selenocysteine lyase/cysteine desulfurase